MGQYLVTLPEIESETSETGIAFIAWELEINSGVITNVETADEEYVHHSPIYGVYDETYYSSADVTIIFNLGGTSDMIDGVFIVS